MTTEDARVTEFQKRLFSFRPPPCVSHGEGEIPSYNVFSNGPANQYKQKGKFYLPSKEPSKSYSNEYFDFWYFKFILIAKDGFSIVTFP